MFKKNVELKMLRSMLKKEYNTSELKARYIKETKENIALAKIDKNGFLRVDYNKLTNI